MFLNINKNKLTKLFASFFLTLGILLAYTSISKYIEPLNDEILEISINDIVQISDSIAKNIVKVSNTNNFVKSIITQEVINQKVNILLKTLQTDNIQYVYMVFKSKDRYRYLLDVSATEQSEALEYFSPIDITKWNKVYESAQNTIVLHHDDQNLGFTYLKAIVINNTTVAILAIDYARSKLQSIQKLKSKIELIVLSLLIFSITFFFGLVFQTYRTFFLKEKAFRDSLTLLHNRHYLIYLQKNIDFSKYFILLIDIDFFKRINDSYGHNTGDYILSQFSKKLLTFKRDKDFLIRYGGEEFLLLLYKDIQKPFEYANSIRMAIKEANCPHENVNISLSISIGLYLNEHFKNNINLAINNADKALYEAKRTGRDKVIVSNNTLKENIELATIRQLINDDFLFCQYHSIIDINSNKTSHYEALARLKENNKTIYPDNFIPEIENTSLYTQMTKKIFLLNIEKLKEHKNISLSINFSPQDLLDDGILALLLQYKEYASRILIEILETQSVSYNLLNDSLKNLRKVGYSVCIDDFGSGYSNFTNLLQIDIDYLKLDGSLIKDIAINPKTYLIVESIVHLCKKTNIKIIAEYVESQEILDCLKKLKIEYAQGYYFSKPKALEAYVEIV